MPFCSTCKDRLKCVLCNAHYVFQDNTNYKSSITDVPIVSLKRSPLTGLSPRSERLPVKFLKDAFSEKVPVKFVKDAFSVNQCHSVLQLVGGWLQNFWQV